MPYFDIDGHIYSNQVALRLLHQNYSLERNTSGLKYHNLNLEC